LSRAIVIADWAQPPIEPSACAERSSPLPVYWPPSSGPLFRQQDRQVWQSTRIAHDHILPSLPAPSAAILENGIHGDAIPLDGPEEPKSRVISHLDAEASFRDRHRADAPAFLAAMCLAAGV